MGAGVELRILSMNYMNFCFVVYIRDSVSNGVDGAYSTNLIFLIRYLNPISVRHLYLRSCKIQ